VNEPIVVLRAVLDGIEAVRRSGRTNMLDRPVVARLCDELGHYAAALWVSEHRDLYARGIFHGFRAAPDARSTPTTTTEPAEGEVPRGAGVDEPRTES
jgi:hypothetical protein